MASDSELQAETIEIRRVIRDSIGWAATKDKDLLYSCFAQDAELFWFSPDDAGTQRGFESFTETVEGVVMKEEFQAVGMEIRELAIRISPSGDAAWWHCRLDDFNTWKGQPINWNDVRWTGVLEKREGRWLIVQMHFSDASDKS